MRRITARGLVLLAILAAGIAAALWLDLGPAGLVPSEGGLAATGRFFAAALRPAVYAEGGTGAFIPGKALAACWTTLVFAATGISLSLVLGVVLGFLASSAWWGGDVRGVRGRWARVIGPVVYGTARVVIALMRSVHELLWAILFLAAFGLSHANAILAIAIPFGGTLAKIFSEMIDEAPRDAATALRGAGAGPMQVYCFGLLPAALPDMGAYAFYRFECALRSSAILGFFGLPTLGYFLKLSFDNLYYREVWTYLYALVLLVVLADWWSGAWRRKGLPS